MADTFSISLQALVYSTLFGSLPITPPILTSSAGVHAKSKTILASGDNTITPPTGAKFCLVIFGGSSTYKLKGVAGDTGITLNSVSSKWTFIPTAAAFIINSSALDTVASEIFWF